MEKYLLALSRSRSPSVFDTRALPPVPIIKPKAASAIRNGMMRLTEAKALEPTTLEMKSPSTIP